MAEYDKKAISEPVGNTPDRVRPHAEAVERSMLASMLREPQVTIDYLMERSDILSLFYSARHLEICKAILALYRDEKLDVDIVSVGQYLREKNKLEAVGGEVFIAELYNSIATTAHLESWFETLKKYSFLRRMIDVCQSGLSRCYDNNSDIGEVVNSIESDIYNIRESDQRRTIVQLSDLLEPQLRLLLDIYNGKVESGIPTGFAPIDRATGGLKRGEMFVLAARPGIGKTALALNIIRNITIMREENERRAVAFFSLEMTAEEIARRLISTQSQIPTSAFRNKTLKPSDTPRLTQAVKELNSAQLYIDPTPGLTISELRAKARRLRMENHIELVVIDYLQLMGSDEKLESRQQEVAKISGGIKSMAKDLNIPVLVLAQLNREIDKNTNKNARPKLANLRESGAIEQDADIVSFLHRDREKAKGMEEGSTDAEWIIEKNRNGKTENCQLLFYPSRVEFMVKSPETEQYAPESIKR